MTSLTLLDSVKHADLRLQPNSGLDFARQHHVLPLRAEEIAKACSDFPIFMTRNTHNGSWSFSLVSSFEVERNLYALKDIWDATYIPQVVETYPFYLMQTGDVDQLAVAIDESSNAFDKEHGEALFSAEGKLAPWLDQLTKRLHTQLAANEQTDLFVKAIEAADLIKEIGLKVIFNDDAVHSINGLHTIDEDKLQALDTDTLNDFSRRGYLSPLYGLLHSIYQLNALIRRHNHAAISDESLRHIRQIKLEVARDAGAADHVV